MARYDYKCPNCETTFEVEHPMSEHPEVRCPECGSVANQVFGTAGIVFKGSGFYNTDQRKGSTSAQSAPQKKESDSKPASSGSTDSSSSGDKKSSSTPAKDSAKKAD